jgi:eukaryotic-like serine/threonine-protein kinase
MDGEPLSTEPNVSDPMIGRMIDDRYEVKKNIGEGGMGVIYLAIQHPIGRRVALKILSTEFSDDSHMMKRFLNEARIISTLKHPNTVSLVDFGSLTGGRLFIAMEYIGGGQLRDLIDRGRVAQVPVLRMARQVLQSLAEAHAKGITHRDLKPENILLDNVAGEDFMVRVVDFGIAKLNPALMAEATSPPMFDAMATAPGTRLGTPAYIPPEQAFAREIDGRADLYALGVVLFEMLTGHLPFKSDSSQGLYLEHLHTPARAINEVAPDVDVDPEVSTLVLRMMAKDKESRPGTCDEVIRVIDGVLARLAPPTAEAQPAPVTLPPAELRAAADDDAPMVVSGGPPVWVWLVLVAGILGILAAAVLR